VDNLRKRYQGAQDKIRRTGSGSGDTREGEIVGDRLPMEHVHDHAWRKFAFMKVQDRDLDARRRSLRDKGVLLFGGSAVVSKATVKHAGSALQTSKPSGALSSAGPRGGGPCSMRRRGHGIHLATDSLSPVFVARVRRNADYCIGKCAIMGALL
jgi:hypothetical protein